MRDIIILRTALLYEADMLACALDDSGVPNYQQQMNFAGVRAAMLPFPVQGPGQFFHVLVPEIAVPHAREILDSLPINQDNHPGMWSFNPKPWAKRFLITLAPLYLISLFMSFVLRAITYPW